MAESKAKPKAKGTSGASKPSKSAAKSKSLPKAGVKTTTDAKATRAPVETAARLNDKRIQPLADWRAETLAEVRRIIHEVAPDIVEERKWAKASNPAGVPVWLHVGIVCTGETYKEVVKLTFARGAALEDPRRLFNSSLEGNTRRAIDIREGDVLDRAALKALIRAAIAENLRSSASKSKPQSKSESKTAPKGGARPKPVAETAKPTTVKKGEKADVVLLAGGNPRIAKADGNAPVQAYIAAMPGWKRDLGKRLDALIVRHVPHVRKAVKWNSPFYGVEEQGWFLSFHVFTHYVKVSFFRGTSLRPVPPGGTGKDARWIDIRERDGLDEEQIVAWVKQAAALPGWLA